MFGKDNIIISWDIPIQTDREIKEQKRKKNCVLIDMAIPTDTLRNTSVKVTEKLQRPRNRHRTSVGNERHNYTSDERKGWSNTPKRSLAIYKTKTSRRSHCLERLERPTF